MPANSDPKPSMARVKVVTHIPGPQFPLMRINLHPKDFVMFLFIQPNPPAGRLQFTPGVERQGLKGRNKAADEVRATRTS